MERASNRFHLPMVVEHTDCFLYDFKEEARKSMRTIPIIDYIWQEGIMIIMTPTTIPPVLSCIEKNTEPQKICLLV